jgi:Phycobilisome degradation protein nblA
MMDLPMELSLEQKFNLKMYESQVKGLSQEQAQSFLLELMRQMMVKENVIKHLIKQS